MPPNVLLRLLASMAVCTASWVDWSGGGRLSVSRLAWMVLYRVLYRVGPDVRVVIRGGSEARQAGVSCAEPLAAAAVLRLPRPQARVR